MVLSYVLMALGVALLWKGADLLVEGAVAMAHRLGVRPLVIGLTVVSFGTSAPELSVNLLAALRGSTALAVGNVVGSNVANTFLVLGAGAVVAPLVVRRSTVRSELPYSLLLTAVVALLINEGVLGQAGLLGRLDGLVLLALFAGFLFYVHRLVRRGREGASLGALSAEVDVQREPVLVSTLRVVAGLAGLLLGGAWIVDGALDLAAALGVSEGFIGFSVVALGTSLPEVATTVVAAYRGQSDLAVGNVVGSNVFNLGLVLGATALVRPIAVDLSTNLDLAVVFLGGVLVALFIRGGRPLERPRGLLLLATYVAYLVLLVVRG